MKTFLKILICLTAALFIHTKANAHEFWVEPSNFSPDVDTAVKVELLIGERFQGEPIARNSAHIHKFVLLSEAGTEDITGIEEVSPAGAIRTKTEGLHIIGYQSTPQESYLEADEFEMYLAEEGLDYISELRSERDQSNEPGIEIFTRCAKAIFFVKGEKKGIIHNHNLGFPLELIPESDPNAFESGSEFSLQLLYQGRPLENSIIVAVNKDDPEELMTSLSDENGEASFLLEKEGVWMFTTIHMDEADGQTQADWQSFWASLTLEI